MSPAQFLVVMSPLSLFCMLGHPWWHICDESQQQKEQALAPIMFCFMDLGWSSHVSLHDWMFLVLTTVPLSISFWVAYKVCKRPYKNPTLMLGREYESKFDMGSDFTMWVFVVLATDTWAARSDLAIYIPLFFNTSISCYCTWIVCTYIPSWERILSLIAFVLVSLS